MTPTSEPPMQPFTEPWRTTALRTGGLALAVGVGAGLVGRQLGLIPRVTLLALWFTLGGHFLELLFRNHLRQHISGRPLIQALARVACWFAGGSVLFVGALATRALLTGQRTVPWLWWQVALAFVGAELLIHLGLRMRGRSSIYDGHG